MMVTRILGALFGTLVFFSALPATATIFTNTVGNYIGVYDDTNTYAWAEADPFAQANFGTRLASIHSSSDQTLALAARILDTPTWIGLHDSVSEGIFEWLDGAPFGFTNFAAGEPNHSGASGVYLGTTSQSGQWFDTSLTTTFNQFIVNVTDFVPPDPPTGIPAPAGSALLGFGVLLLGLRRDRKET